MCRKHIWILIAVVLLNHNINTVAVGLTSDAADLTDYDEILEVSSEADAGEDVLYNVSFPTDIHAYLDPGDLSGRGQIFSDRYEVKNYGNTDVVIKIKNINVYYISTEDIYEFSEEEIVDGHSRIKKLNIHMVWVNEAEQTEKVLCVSEGIYDECVLFLAASEYNENGEFADLREGSSGFFYFTGTLNSNPNLIWENGEITACFDYEIVNTESEEENVREEDPAEPQEDAAADESEVPLEDTSEHPEETADPEEGEIGTSEISEEADTPEEDSGGQKAGPDTSEASGNSEETAGSEKEENSEEQKAGPDTLGTVGNQEETADQEKEEDGTDGTSGVTNGLEEETGGEVQKGDPDGSEAAEHSEETVDQEKEDSGDYEIPGETDIWKTEEGSESSA